MKALSIRQPWAGLILRGLKDIENRDWTTKYRGVIAIHASQALYWDDFNAASATCKSLGIRIENPVEFDEFQRGAIVGTVELIDVVTDSDSPWFLGAYGWVLRNPRIVKPIPYKGKLGFWTFPDDLIH